MTVWLATATFPIQGDALTERRATEIAALLERAGDSAVRAMSIDLALECYVAAQKLRMREHPEVEAHALETGEEAARNRPTGQGP